MLSSGSFIILPFTFTSITYQELFMCTAWRGDNFHFFQLTIQLAQHYCLYSSFCTADFVISQICVPGELVSVLNCFLWSICLYLPQYCFNCCTFTLSLEIGWKIPTPWFFSFKIILAILGHLPFHIHVQIHLSVSKKKREEKKNPSGILIGIVLILHIIFGKTGILIILSLPIICLFRTFKFCFNTALWLSV